MCVVLILLCNILVIGMMLLSCGHFAFICDEYFFDFYNTKGCFSNKSSLFEI
jgi:hypothetical protein